MIEPSAAADYADAMITARRAKGILVLIVLLCLLIQLVLFFLARYKIDPAQDVPSRAALLLRYFMDLIDFIGLIAPIVLCVVLFLLTVIMLVGRLIGVSHVVASFLWCVLLVALLFPWQGFLADQTFASADFKIPGILYTWGELVFRAREVPKHVLLYWARFVGFPIVAIIVLLAIQFLSRKGLRMALGEASPTKSAAPTRAEEPPAPQPT